MATSHTPRILVVDDEADIRHLICDFLSKDGYELCACSGADELDAALGQGPADAVILDITMPGEDGLSIARRLRANSCLSIIILTALDNVVDRIVGLEIGADDYVAKPFDVRELRARVRAVMRRAGRIQSSDAGRRCERVNFGAAFLDLESRELLGADGSEIHLTATEFDLLVAFSKNPNRVLSRDQLLDVAPGRDCESFDRAIDIRVNRIRKKIEQNPSKPQVIKTVRSAGYMFVPPSQTSLH